MTAALNPMVAIAPISLVIGLIIGAVLSIAFRHHPDFEVADAAFASAITANLVVALFILFGAPS